MPRRPFAICLAASILIAGLAPGPAARAAEEIRAVRVDDATKTAAAVVVDGAKHLAYTSQILPLDEQARDIAVDNVERQAQAVLDHLEHALKPAGSGIDRLVKVNVYLARSDLREGFQAVLARRMGDRGSRPAVCYVTTPLPRPNVLLGIDAVAVSDRAPTRAGNVDRFNLTDLTVQRVGNHVAILPAGARLFISGQAEPGADMAEATRKTLAGLDQTLKHFGLTRKQVVQVKSFITPIGSVADAESEMIDYFGPVSVPPLSFVEWKSAASQPIEIEMVVAAGNHPEAAPIEYLAPPQLKQSPVFSRVVRINHGNLIYTSGLDGPARAGGAEQVGAIFSLLEKVLKESGSDLKHMAKATYYVSDEEASRALNEIRPKLYDPARPPAASKAMVGGVGSSGRTVTLDLIAAPAR